MAHKEAISMQSVEEDSKQSDNDDVMPLMDISESKNKKNKHKRKKSSIDFIEDVKRCCEDKEDLDLFQVMAFDSSTRTTCWDYITWFFNIIKCIFCACTQIIGIMILIYEVVVVGLEQKEWCNTNVDENLWYNLVETEGGTIRLKVLGFFFSSFLAYFSLSALSNIDKGMYTNMNYAAKVPWISQFWLRFGLSVNVFVAIAAVYGSFLVIFFSEFALDMILNSVALFFLVELDDMLIGRADYERIMDHIEEHEDDGNIQEVKKTNCCKRCFKCICNCCDMCFLCIGWLYTLPFQGIRYFTMLVCIVLPFYIAVCY